eukprot:TRINITY_DN2526_c0_g1_i1.p1 TRINITY_DN2526_c0_g1~~TRINITY_DN2526_c0_g1_i1.p1  ORF type:complete len:183 (+),score=4.95 TRINITY_DN2526_c0_g1_i1:59-607(+)
MSVVCSACNGQILDICLNAFQMTWHPHCLCCYVCGKDFSDGSRVEEGEDGYAYCTKDYIDTFAPKCAGCAQSILGQCLDAMGKKWHPEHFVCGTCKVPFTGQFFSTEDGVPYCEKHYYEATGMLCADCERPIVSGKCVQFLDRKFHPEHFKCTYCKKNLVGQPYMKHNAKPYCKTCHTALFG